MSYADFKLICKIVVISALVCWASYLGYMLARALTEPDRCVDRQPFTAGNSTLGVSGSYCARWRAE